MRLLLLSITGSTNECNAIEIAVSALKVQTWELALDEGFSLFTIADGVEIDSRNANHVIRILFAELISGAICASPSHRIDTSQNISQMKSKLIQFAWQFSERNGVCNKKQLVECQVALADTETDTDIGHNQQHHNITKLIQNLWSISFSYFAILPIFTSFSFLHSPLKTMSCADVCGVWRVTSDGDDRRLCALFRMPNRNSREKF